MNIDITKPAMSSSDLEQKRSDLESEAASLTLSLKRFKLKLLLAGIMFLSILLSLNIFWSFFPWKLFFLSFFFSGAAAFASTYRFAPTFSFAVAASFAGLIGATVGATSLQHFFPAVSAFGAVTVAITVCLSVVLPIHQSQSAINILKFDRDMLNDADKARCLEIVKWLDCPEIATFRDSIQEQSRRFVSAEVDAMKLWYEGIEDRKSPDEKEKQVDQACKEVYLGNLASPS